VQSSNAQTSNAQTSNVNVGDTSLLASDIPISENSSKKFFKQKNAQSSNVNVGDTSSPAFDIPISENSSKRLRGVDGNEFNISSLEYDHGLRRQI
jgi:hypothetical protein